MHALPLFRQLFSEGEPRTLQLRFASFRGMALRMRAALLTAAAAFVASQDGPTPVSKVIELLEGLQSDVVAEGQAEAAAYDTFSCWCRDTTKSKSDAILGGRDNINELSAEIQEPGGSVSSMCCDDRMGCDPMGCGDPMSCGDLMWCGDPHGMRRSPRPREIRRSRAIPGL